MIEILHIFILFTLLLESDSFSSYQTHRGHYGITKVEENLHKNVKQISKITYVSKNIDLSMHMGHSHSHHDHDHKIEKNDNSRKALNGPDLSFSLWGQLLRPREFLSTLKPQGKIFIAALFTLVPALIRRRKLNKIGE